MKIVVCGVGNRLRGDDAIGLLIIEELKKENLNAILINTGSAPENYLQKIINLNPDILLIIDAVDFKGIPGQTKIVNVEELEDKFFSTHSLSLKFLTQYLKQFLPDLKILLIGIQPKDTNLREGITKELKEKLPQIKKEIIKMLKNY